MSCPAFGFVFPGACKVSCLKGVANWGNSTKRGTGKYIYLTELTDVQINVTKALD